MSTEDKQTKETKKSGRRDNGDGRGCDGADRRVCLMRPAGAQMLWMIIM